MKKLLLLLLLILIGCSEEKCPDKIDFQFLIEERTEKIDNYGELIFEYNIYCKINGKPYTGVIFNYDTTEDIVRSEVYVKNGKFHGTYKTWYHNGRLCEIGRYINGKTEGVWTKYFPNGSKEYQTTYVDGKLVNFENEF